MKLPMYVTGREDERVREFLNLYKSSQDILYYGDGSCLYWLHPMLHEVFFSKDEVDEVRFRTLSGYATYIVKQKLESRSSRVPSLFKQGSLVSNEFIMMCVIASSDSAKEAKGLVYDIDDFLDSDRLLTDREYFGYMMSKLSFVSKYLNLLRDLKRNQSGFYFDNTGPIDSSNHLILSTSLPEGFELVV